MNFRPLFTPKTGGDMNFRHLFTPKRDKRLYEL